MNDAETLLDASLVPDPDADCELGPGDVQMIADEELKGCRLLLVRRAVEAIDLEGTHGGAIEFGCTFHPAKGTRFTWARLRLRLTTPEGIRIIDLAPREVSDEPVRVVIDRKGRLSLGYKIVEADVEQGVSKEFEDHHRTVQGSGEGTALARWDFAENPHRRAGLGGEQALILTLPTTGTVIGTVGVNARVARSGLHGVVDAVRDLVLGSGPDRDYPISFDIPQTPPPTGLARLFRFID